MKTIFSFLLVTLLSIQLMDAQVVYSSKVQNVNNENDTFKLFFVDFWATWCGPCAYATTHINQIRDKFSTDIYVATMSQEGPELISKYLLRHKNTLDVYSDFEGETFGKYGINVLPNGILFNAKGEILWQGNPADFSPGLVSKFLRANKIKRPVSHLFKQILTNDEIEESNVYKPTKDFELKVLNKQPIEELLINKYFDYTYYEGSLKQLLANSNEKSLSQIKVTPILDKKIYGIYLKNDLSSFLENLILDNLDLVKNEVKLELETLVFDMTNSKL